MRPTLFSLRFDGHELGLHSYGLLVGLGFAVGIVLFWREGRRQGFDGGRLLDLSFWSIVAGLVGSRVTFVALNARDFADACFGPADGGGQRISGCFAALRFWEGGFVFYGGAAATGLVILLFCRREGWSFWRLGDLAAPTLAVGHALGRLGCFLAGCCFGKTCLSPWAVSFPPGSVAYDELREVGIIGPLDRFTPALHPTQLYEACGELVLFALLLVLRRRWRPVDNATGGGRDDSGRLILTYAGCYAILRLVVEIFRGDSSRRYLWQWTWPRLARALALSPDQPILLSVSQFASVLVLAAVCGTFLWRRRERSISESGSHSGDR